MTDAVQSDRLPARGHGRGLDIYVIDTGINSKAKSVLDAHLRQFEPRLARHRIFRLTPEQSKGLIQADRIPSGSDPVLVLVDSDAHVEKRSQGYGLRISLGKLSVSEIGDRLNRFLSIACEPYESPLSVIANLQGDSFASAAAGTGLGPLPTESAEASAAKTAATESPRAQDAE